MASDPSTTDVTVIGIGSPHGDDQAGWAVIDRLRELPARRLRVRKVQNPIEMIDDLRASSRVYVVDSATGLDLPVERLVVADPQVRRRITTERHRLTHDFGVKDALDLAESLGRPTDQIVLWLIRGERFDAMSTIRNETVSGVDHCVAMIRAELALLLVQHD